jgi:predicted ATPase/DNA-binding winged helix-turn-helix (wHTH) protein
MPASYRFGDFELDLAQRRLLASGTPAPLGARAFDVLRVLVERRERPVPKDELLDAVWPEQDVEEGNLPVHVSALRKVLGPQAISTVPGRGYRFMLAVQGDPTAAAPARADSQPAFAATRHNLPLQATPLLGRDSELSRAGRDLASARLLSIVGASGIGKTRFALSLAWSQVQAQPDGVWWAELADASDDAAIFNRIGTMLGLPVARAEDPRVALLKGLQGLNAIVVLDNCEHLVGPVAALVQGALDSVPGVRWLVTSQEPLKLPAEKVIRLGTLAVPPADSTLADALQYGALALLSERARAADRRFSLTAGTLPCAIEICQRLDGIALALEMAAARVPWMGVEGVRDRLAEGLRLLSSPRRDGPSRHRTLLAAIEWSHALLSPQEQIVFRRLAVCHGGFALEQAAQLAADAHGIDPWVAADAIGALVDKSLVQIEGDRAVPRPRLRLLESTRMFAMAQLTRSGELDGIRRQHAEVYAQFAAREAELHWSQADATWLATNEPETLNLRQALSVAVQTACPDLIEPLFTNLHWLSIMLNGGIDLRRWAEAIEALLPRAEPAQQARLLLTLGRVFRNSAHLRAAALCQQGLLLAGPSSDQGLLYRLLCACALLQARAGLQDEAVVHLARATAVMDPAWPPRLLLLQADASAFVALGARDLPLAREHFRRFRALALECGADSGMVVVSHNLADLALCLGEADEAVRLGRELVARLRRGRNRYNLGFALGNLCAALIMIGDHAGALEAAQEALPLLRAEDQAIWLFDHLALLAARQGRLNAAARLQGYTDATRRANASVRDPCEMRAHREALEIIQGALGDDESARLQAEGALLAAAHAHAQADLMALDRSLEPSNN